MKPIKSPTLKRFPILGNEPSLTLTTLIQRKVWLYKAENRMSVGYTLTLIKPSFSPA